MSPKPINFAVENVTIGMSSHWVQNWKCYYIYVLDNCPFVMIATDNKVFWIWRSRSQQQQNPDTEIKYSVVNLKKKKKKKN